LETKEREEGGRERGRELGCLEFGV